MHRRACRKVSVIAIVFLCLFSFSTVGCAPTPSPTKTASANLKRLKQQVDTVKATEKVQKTQVAARHLGAGKSEPIYHEKTYPAGSGPFPAVIALHTAGGLKRFKHLIQRYVDDGFAVYAPDYFTRHDINAGTRRFAFTSHRERIENDLSEIIDLMKQDPKIDKNNIFAAGYSAGGFYVCFLTGKAMVNAGVALYGVWSGPKRWGMRPYPVKYFSKSSTPILALHGEDDGTQRMRFVEQAWDEAKNNGATLETHVYPGADHAWDRKGSNKWDYNEEVDKDSHKRTIEFFKKHMK